MKKIFLTIMACGTTLLAGAQYTFDALQYSTDDLRGTARYQSLAGSMGALGGDMTAINDNPGGIGVYRSSDVSITASLDFNNNKTTGNSNSMTRFNCINVGYVGAMRLNSDVMPYFQWGLTYNRKYDARRRFLGGMDGIHTSITNYYADWATHDGITPSNLSMDAFYKDNGGSWGQILTYQGNAMIHTGGNEYSGLGVDGTYGYNEFEIQEHGHTDEFDVTLGGNINNKVHWGIGFGYVDMLYKYYKYYGEVLENTVVWKDDKRTETLDGGNASLGYSSGSRTTGTGYNFKFGVIFKPVNEFRIGLAVHTPTFLRMKDTYTTTISTAFYDGNTELYTIDATSPTNSVWYRIRTPWRLLGSIGVVAGQVGLINAEYECRLNNSMRIGDTDNYWYPDATSEIKEYLQPTHIFKIGGEVRASNKVSIRAGYQYRSSAAKQEVKDDKLNISVSGSCPIYSYDNNQQFITAGLGYRSGGFYADLAYVHKIRNNVTTFVPGEVNVAGYSEAPIKADVKGHDNRIALTLGYRF